MSTQNFKILADGWKDADRMVEGRKGEQTDGQTDRMMDGRADGR